MMLLTQMNGEVNSGANAVGILANLCHAGPRAQAHPSRFWRVLSFLFGMPGTIVSLIVVGESSGRAYGIDLPRRGDSR
jgi:hypothetical protein